MKQKQKSVKVNLKHPKTDADRDARAASYRKSNEPHYKPTGDEPLCLWLSGPLIEGGQYDSVIIAAVTCKEARKIAGNDVLLLGEAMPGVKAGIVLRSNVNDEPERYAAQSDRLASWRGHFSMDGR